MMKLFTARLAELSAMDPSRRVFGAKTHNYRGSPLSMADLEAFEAESGCQLPTDYRRFLAEIGTGVGPYYGLLSLGKIREELQMIAEDHLEENDVRARPCDAFALEAQILDLQLRNVVDFAPLKCPSNPGGFIPICHHGCEFVTVLVVSGALTGAVVDTTNFASIRSEWCPAKCPPGIVQHGRRRFPIPDFPLWPSFADWIDGWIRQGIIDYSMGDFSI